MQVTHLIAKLLQDPNSYARLLFVHFSSAFHTIQPRLLMGKLKDPVIHPRIIRWYYSFVMNPKQQLSVDGALSEPRTLRTGVPQGCVSSPVLFTLYTVRAGTPKITSFKFSDDTAILALLNKGYDRELSHYRSEIPRFVNWRAEEMIFDLRRGVSVLDRITGKHVCCLEAAGQKNKRIMRCKISWICVWRDIK